MAPDTGTPDHVASKNRTRSRRSAHVTHMRAWLPALAPLACGRCWPGAPRSRRHRSRTAVRMPRRSLSGHRHRRTTRSPRGGRHRARTATAQAPRGREAPARIRRIRTNSSFSDGVPTVAPTDTGPREDASERPDAWARIRGGLSLPHPLHPRVERQIEWYRKNPEYLDRLAQRARPYLAYIVREVEKKGLPAEFALLPVVESAFKSVRVLAQGRIGAVAVHAVDRETVRTEAELVVRRTPRRRRVDARRAPLSHQAPARISTTIACSRSPPTTGAKATSGAR